jgi:hypothetical protein
MVRIFSDFNARTKEGECWILMYGNNYLDNVVDDLCLSDGSKVILYQDDGDFDVIATLRHKYIDVLKRNAWVAAPDWSTIRRD